MRKSVAAVLCVSFAAVVACSVGGGGSPPAAVDASQALDPATEPVQVSLSTDSSHAVSADIPLEGGTLTATAADGTRFTLVIPSGALVQPTTITMTPLASMEGLPFGEGAPMAVLLEPSGLTFYDFVTLTVEPGSDLPIDQQIPIGTSGPGNDLEMPFAEIADGVLQLKLLHFSSAGATKGFLADTEPWRQRLGGDVETRLRSVVAREMLYHKQKDEPVPASFWQWLKQTWWDNVMKPRLDAAGESCAAGRLAIETALSFERQAQLMGFGEDGHNLVQTVWDLLPTVARQCLQEEYELCRDEHIVHRILPVLLAIERQSQLAGLSGAAMGPVLAEGMDLARKCLHFELEFESEATLGYSSAVESRVPIELTFDGESVLSARLKGQADLVNTDFEYAVPGCTVTTSTGNGTFTVSDLGWDVKYETEIGSIGDIRLNYDPGVAAEQAHGSCTSGLIIETGGIAGLFWNAAYSAGHLADEIALGAGPSGPSIPMPDPTAMALMPGGRGQLPGQISGMGQGFGMGSVLTVKGWDVHGEELFAERSWETSLGGSGSETGSMKLYHRPR